MGRGLGIIEQLYRDLGPHCELAEQPADEANGCAAAAGLELIWCDQIAEDVVVVASVHRDFLVPPGLGDAVEDVERAVAIERRDLDPGDAIERGEATPEIARQHSASDRRL